MGYENCGRPPGEVPYIERRPSGSWRWRRSVPIDLRQILGEAWIYTFALGTPLESIKAAAEALAYQTDEIIAERRKRLGRDAA